MLKKNPGRLPAIGTPRNQRGVGLIEVLIAVLIMAIGMLGIAAMQAMALRNSQGSLGRSQATVQTYAIIDAMRANRDIAIANGYNMGRTCAVLGTTDRAGLDRSRWISDMQATVAPGSCGTIACAGNNCQVSVEWDESHASDGPETAGSTTYTLNTQVLL